MIENVKAQVASDLADSLEKAAAGSERESEGLEGARKAFIGARKNTVGSVFEAVKVHLAEGVITDEMASTVRSYLVKLSQALQSAEIQAEVGKISLKGKAAGQRSSAKVARELAKVETDKAEALRAKMAETGKSEGEARRPRSGREVRKDIDERKAAAKSAAVPAPATPKKVARRRKKTAG